MKIVLVVGARPQFIKAAAIYRALPAELETFLLHTGQHYDENMSAVFFRELDIPEPSVNLGVGSAPHGAQTASMLLGIEAVLLAEKPDAVVVFGDTNSTLAGALAAAKLSIPLAHVEAGLRSFNRRMPEELNRVLTDHASDLLFCPSQTAVDNLAREGIHSGVHLVGDVMADVLAFASQRARTSSSILERLGLQEGGYLLVTLHRAENTDDPSRLGKVISALRKVEQPVVFPAHPRTLKALRGAGLAEEQAQGLGIGSLKVIQPLGYLDMVRLEASSRLVLTDSGGVQKEAYWLGVPCVTLRDESEWVETVQAGWNVLVGVDPERILRAVHTLSPPLERPQLYGDGQASQRIVAILNGSRERL